MRLSSEHIRKLQVLLKEIHGLDYSDEQVQEAGMAIMRFVQVKVQRKQELAKLKENENGSKRYDGATS